MPAGRPKKKEVAYIAGLDWNFEWCEEDMIKLEKSYTENLNIQDIAIELNRPEIEILIMLADLIEHDSITPREKKIYGRVS